MSDIPKKNIQCSQESPQPDGETDLKEKQRQHGQHGPTGKLSDRDQKQDENPHHDHVIDGRRDHDKQWQARPRKMDFLQQLGMLNEDVLHAGQHFGKILPVDDAGAQIDAVRERAVDARQSGHHDLRKNKRVYQYLGKRIQNGPKRAEERVHVADAEIPGCKSENKRSVIPQSPQNIASFPSGTQETHYLVWHFFRQ